MSSTVLSCNLGHDGAAVFLREGVLEFSIEREKNSFPRFSRISVDLIYEALELAQTMPDVFAIGGWHTGVRRGRSDGYHGIEDKVAMLTPMDFFGSRILLFQSTHERSHIFCSYGLSPFEQGEPCYVLVWEGEIGSFYEIDENLHVARIGAGLDVPGYKYSFAFELANPAVDFGSYRLDSAGKLMALASYSTHGTCTELEQKTISRIFEEATPPRTDKRIFSDTPYLNCGVTAPKFTELAGKFSDAIFDNYFRFAAKKLTKGYPLLVSGGCGLNCEWNSRWRDSALFRDVFVPPVTNDSGSAIGTAIEAQYKVTGAAKVKWSVYSGLDFVWDRQADDFAEIDFEVKMLAGLLAEGLVLAWVQGRFEIGPRALGNRSLLAAPFDMKMKDRLNWIKHREPYRPVAPVCLEEDAAELFGVSHRSPHMLYLFKTRVSELRAVTHVDGSSRVQTVSPEDNPKLYQLLTAFKCQTGFGVLCNTSLNYPGKGFINQSSDLFHFVRSRGIDGAVVNDRLYVPKTLATAITRTALGTEAQSFSISKKLAT
jgi:predicted NodU family carbamoyl transferase